MAMNPKTWAGPTPWSHNAKLDKSGPDKNLSAHGRPTMVKPTGMDMQGPTPKSGSGYRALGHPNYEGIGNPTAMSSDRDEMPTNMAGMPSKNDKSEPMPPKEPKKWSKKYNMAEGQHMSEGAGIAFNKREKAH